MSRWNTCRSFLLIGFYCLLASEALMGQSHLLAGPMCGQVTDSSAVIWVWVQPDDSVSVAVSDQDASPNIAAFASELADSTGIVKLYVSGLSPETPYRYTIWMGKEGLPHMGSFRTFPRQEVFDFEMAVGSCAYMTDSATEEIVKGVKFGKHYQIFDTIANRNPALMLWLGDNLYLRNGEWNDRERVRYRYLTTRQHPSYAHLLRTGSHLATWDDHDFGPNDSGANFEGKGMTREAFLQQWLNPPTAAESGIYTAHRIGDVEIYLLDGRSFRKQGDLLGQAQLNWLCDRLRQSDARFKLIAMGGQVLSTSRLGEAFWGKNPEILKVFMDSLAATRADGICFMTGDIHHAEISRYDFLEGYPVYDFTFSPLTSLPYPIPVRNRRKVRKSVFKRRNFGWLAFRGEGKSRRMEIQCIDRKGRVLWSHVIFASSLTWPEK